MLTLTLEIWSLSRNAAAAGAPVPHRATAVWEGKRYEQIDAHGAIFALARQLVADGCPDQPWEAVGTNGVVRLRGPSLHGLAKSTIRESGTQTIRRVPYVPLPEGHLRPQGSVQDGSEASGRDANESLPALRPARTHNSFTGLVVAGDHQQAAGI